jgi:very-short-patch-repair endonuclease
MRPLPAIPSALIALLTRQEGAVTKEQALATGLTESQLRTLVLRGWTRPTRGILVAPNPADPFRTSLRAALLACPEGVVAGMSAARLRKLGGLPIWTPDERPHLLLPAGRRYEARQGVSLRSGLKPGEATWRDRLPITTLDRTVTDMAQLLSLDDLVCLVDSALRVKWHPSDPKPKLRAALALSDGRSESTFETLIRLLLIRAGIPPEELQFKVYDAHGRQVARVDLAWPSVKLALEADGREHHDAPKALYRDRARGNDLANEGWTTLRVTWADLQGAPQGIVEMVDRAVIRLSAIKSAA